MEKVSPNRAQLFVRNKYTVFTMGGTVALRSVNTNFPESYSSAANANFALFQIFETGFNCKINDSCLTQEV